MKKVDFLFLFLLILIAAILTIPFLSHAYHIDEPLFLKIAEQIKKDFFHPYHFQYFWGDSYLPVDQIAAFPPLFPYYLALINFLVKNSSEWKIHLSLIPFIFIALFSFYGICRRFYFNSIQSFFATVLLIISPSFILTSNMAIPDIPALSLLLASIYLLIDSDSSSIILPIVSGILLGFSTLLRYNFIPFILVLFFFGISFHPFRLRKKVLSSLIAAVLFLGWIGWSAKSNESSHVSTVLYNFLRIDSGAFFSRFISIQTHLTFSTFLPFLFFIFCKIEKRVQFLLFLISIIIGVFLFLLKMVHFFGFVVAGFSIFLSLSTFYFTINFSFSLLKKIDLKTSFENRDFKLALLFLGGFFSLFIPLIYIHFASKYILLIQPFLILIFLSKIEAHFEKVKISFYFVPFILLFSFLLAHADFSFANIYQLKSKSEVLRIQQKHPFAKVWFVGHWGWQYYLEREGASPLPFNDFQSGFPKWGDILLTTQSNSPQNISALFTEKLILLSKEDYFPSFYLRTMSVEDNAGFYSNGWGVFPYSIGKSSLETFKIFQILPDE